MNKRLKIILLTMVALAAAGCAAYLAFGRAGEAYLSMIPKDAKGIAKVDFRAIIKDSGMTSDQQQALLHRLSDDDAMEASGIGVDLSKPLFAFVSKSGFFAVAAKVDDEDALVKALNNGRQHTEVQRQRGYSWALLKGNYLVAFNDDKVLCMGPAVGAAQDQLRNEMYRYLEQDKEKSAVGTEPFNYVSTSHAPGTAILTMSLVPESLRKTVSNYIPASLANDVDVALTLNLGRNDLTLASELRTSNDEAKAKLQAFESLFRTIDGRLVESSSENAFAWWCVNMDGGQVLERLRAIPSIRLALIGMNMMVDFDQMIRSIDGDVAADFAVSQDARGKAELQSRLKAQMKNTDFLKNADYWVKSNRSNLVQALSANDFRLNMSGSPIWFGVDDNILYVTSSEAMRYSKGNTFVTAQESAIKGTRFYATMDLTKAGGYLDDAKPYSDICRSVTLSMKDLGAFTLKVEGARDENLLFDLLMN